MKKTKMEIHDFYCLNCGKQSLSLPRKVSYQHEKFHRKVLFCPSCKQTLNHIEIKNEEEKWEFLENYKNGVYEDERKDSLSYGRAASLW